MFYINTNEETIEDLYDVEEHQRFLLDEAIFKAAAAACDVIETAGYECEYNWRFADWHGGMCYRMNGTSVVAVAAERNSDLDKLAWQADEAFEAALNAVLSVAAE